MRFILVLLVLPAAVLAVAAACSKWTRTAAAAEQAGRCPSASATVGLPGA